MQVLLGMPQQAGEGARLSSGRTSWGKKSRLAFNYQIAERLCFTVYTVQHGCTQIVAVATGFDHFKVGIQC